MGLKLFLTESGEDTFLSILLNPRLGEWDFGVYSDIVGRHVRWDPLCQFNLSLHTFEPFLTRNLYTSFLAHCYLFHLFLHNNDVSG
jgi:hypothetical protein